MALFRARTILFMTARHKKKAPAKPASASAAAHAPGDHGSKEQGSIDRASIDAKRRERLREIFISFALSLSIALLLVALKMKIEKTGFGEQIESMSYDLLQHHLTAPSSIQDLPVIVLDISGVQMRPTLGPSPGLVTDRQSLQAIVQNLAALPSPPAVIGLDVDFSPDSHGYADPDDPGLFDYFLSVDPKIPIRVGVNSSLALGPQKWLGDPKYMELATCVVVPKPDQGQSTRYMPEELVVNYPIPSSPGIDEHCPSLGVNLAMAAAAKQQANSRWPSWLAESFREKKNARISSSEFLVDYSPLDVLSASAPDALNTAALGKADLKGKIVLLGRTQNTTDTFIVPGRSEQVYAGVFLHACAAYTRMQTQPLYRLTEFGRFAFDFGFPLLILGPVLWIRLSRHRKGKEPGIGERLIAYLISGEALILFICAVLFVRYSRLMWDDFILVVIALIAHTPIERAILDLVKGLSGWVRHGKYAHSSGSQVEGE